MPIHLRAEPGDYAEAVLLPGDPLRAKYIAETYLDQPMHVGPIVSSDVFYNADDGQYARWSGRGVLGVEMEAAALFTVAALGGIGRVQGIHGGCLLTVSDIVVEGVFQRISDEELR